MYGHDPKFLHEVNKVCSTLLDQVLSHMKTLDKPEVRETNVLLLP